MLRLIFYLVLGYVVWKVIRVVAQVMSSPPCPGNTVHTESPQPKKSETFKDVRDADFEELPPDEKK